MTRVFVALAVTSLAILAVSIAMRSKSIDAGGVDPRPPLDNREVSDTQLREQGIRLDEAKHIVSRNGQELIARIDAMVSSRMKTEVLSGLTLLVAYVARFGLTEESLRCVERGLGKQDLEMRTTALQTLILVASIKARVDPDLLLCRESDESLSQLGTMAKASRAEIPETEKARRMLATAIQAELFLDVRLDESILVVWLGGKQDSGSLILFLEPEPCTGLRQAPSASQRSRAHKALQRISGKSFRSFVEWSLWLSHCDE